MFGWERKHQTTLDDRGQRVNLLLWEDATATGAVSTWREWMWLILIVLMVVVALGVFFLQPDLSKFGKLGEIAGWIFGAMVIGFVLWMRMYYRHANFYDRRFTEPLRRGHCAQCGWALVGLIPEPDNCIQCPECGAAWKADRLGKCDVSK